MFKRNIAVHLKNDPLYQSEPCCNSEVFPFIICSNEQISTKISDESANIPACKSEDNEQYLATILVTLKLRSDSLFQSSYKGMTVTGGLEIDGISASVVISSFSHWSTASFILMQIKNV